MVADNRHRMYKSTHNIALKIEQSECLIFGYVKNECIKHRITIPRELIELIVLWFHQKYSILQFDKRYSSDICIGQIAFMFEEDRKLLTKLNIGHSYVLADIEPLFEGVHCFRTKTTVVNMGWVSWGVSEREHIGNDSWSSDKTWNVAYNHWSNGCYSNGSKCNEETIDTTYLQYNGLHIVDILLDCDNGKLNMQLMNPKCPQQKYEEIKCWNMPCKENNYNNNINFKGYVPHFNVSGNGITMRLAKIPIEWYGIQPSHDIFEQN
eukprot:346934_1